MAYVITCGDEGIQINQGRKLGVLGAGYGLTDFPQIIKYLKKIFGKEIGIVANAENQWVKEKMDLATWEQTNTSMQQQIQALADLNKLTFVGIISFSDPKMLKFDIKGHMVRPKGIHIANKISFTLAGGEQTFHLGHYVISADWVALAKPALVKRVMQTQIEFYKKQAKMELPFVFETAGELGETVAKNNLQMLEKIGVRESQ